MKIVVVETHAINDIPPTINLTRTLLKKGHEVTLISHNLNALDEKIRCNPGLKLHEIEYGHKEGVSTAKKIQARLTQKSRLKKAVAEEMKNADVLWTTSDMAVRDLGTDVYKYKHVLHLMELIQYGYYWHDHFRYPIEEYAKRAWKVVVAEENRAYIEKAWWGLEDKPFVFPNKPYSLEYGEISKDEEKAVDLIKNENKKIVLYLGGIWEDRNLENFAEALCNSDDYRMAIVGRASSERGEKILRKMVEEFNVLYLGSYPTPKHLAFLKYSYIGLLPYIPSTNGYLSELNALYCAPNKIFEYAGFGLPMLGTDVMGLQYPFQRYNIGRVCEKNSSSCILSALKEIEENYSEMSRNALSYYNVYDLDKIVDNILEE